MSHVTSGKCLAEHARIINIPVINNGLWRGRDDSSNWHRQSEAGVLHMGTIIFFSKIDQPKFRELTEERIQFAYLRNVNARRAKVY